MLKEITSHKVNTEEQRLLASVAKQLLSVSGRTQAAIAAEAGYSGQIFSNLLYGRSVSQRAATAVLDVLQRHTGIDWRKLVEERWAEVRQWKIDLQNLSPGQDSKSNDHEILARLHLLTPGQRNLILQLVDQFTQCPSQPSFHVGSQPTLFGIQDG